MDIKMKHRIIGVVVIVALAVIIVPVFFTRSGNSQKVAPKVVAMEQPVPDAPGNNPAIQLTVPPEAKPAPRLLPNQAPPANLATEALTPGGDQNTVATTAPQPAGAANATSNSLDAHAQQNAQHTAKNNLSTQLATQPPSPTQTSELAAANTASSTKMGNALSTENNASPVVAEPETNLSANSPTSSANPNATTSNNETNVAQPSEPGAKPVPETFLRPGDSPARTKTGAVKSKMAASEKEIIAKTKTAYTHLHKAHGDKHLLAKATQPGQAWAIQLGSFNNKSNADVLVKKLRKQGFAAYLHIARSGSGELTRVYVGPELQREKAENLLRKLNSEFRLNGVVVKYQV